MSQVQAIRDYFHSARLAAQPAQAHRDIAQQLGISEAQLLAAHLPCSYESKEAFFETTYLQAHWPELIAMLECIGEVLASTSNTSCVHEATGIYRQAQHNGCWGCVVGTSLNLQIDYQHWAHGFAVTERLGDAVQRSLQFFDASGTAIHQIYLTANSKLRAYQALVRHFASDHREAEITILPRQSMQIDCAQQEIDLKAFHAAWYSLRDANRFPDLLKTFGLTQQQATQFAPPAFAQALDPTCLRDLLEAASQQQVSMLIGVGNAGVTQSHRGLIDRVAVRGAWTHIFTPAFQLHLREDHIHQAWIVRKPSVRGLVSSLELFDARGEAIATFFGEPHAGKPELCEWRALLDRLQQEADSCLT